MGNPVLKRCGAYGNAYDLVTMWQLFHLLPTVITPKRKIDRRDAKRAEHF